MKRFALVMAGLAGLLILSGCGPGTVEQGELGVVVNWGRVTGELKEPGFYATGFGTGVVHMDMRTQAYTAQASAASNDLQEAATTVVVNYKLDPTKLIALYSTIGLEYQERIIAPAVQESVKATTARFSAGQLITERPVVKKNIEEALRDRLAPLGITVDTVSITEFTFSKGFTEAIEAKVVAAQNAEQASNKLLQVQIEAQQVAAAAEGQRNAAVLRAKGEAQAILTVAQAQAEANKTIATSLTPLVVQYTVAQKLAAGTKTVVVPSGQAFIFGPEVLGEN